MFRVLTAVELGMRRYKIVPVDQIRFFARLSLDETVFRLDALHRLELIVRESRNVVGYYLNSLGYDVLAIHALVQQDEIDRFGPLLGVGKEADVYRCLSPGGEELALKFHRLGRTSFRRIRQLRGYLGRRGHMSWLYASRLSAEREYEGLQRVQPLDIAIPRPVGQNRHAVLMGLFRGDEIRHFHDIPDPKGVYDRILAMVAQVYHQADMVHGDLGEYNILLDEAYQPVIIDWPQWVAADHPHAGELLHRDVTNVILFFKRRFRHLFETVDPEAEFRARFPAVARTGNGRDIGELA